MKKLLLAGLVALVGLFASVVQADPGRLNDFQEVPGPGIRVNAGIYIATMPADGSTIIISTVPSWIHSVIVSSQATDTATDANFTIWNARQDTGAGAEKVIDLDVRNGAFMLGGVYDFYLSSGIIVDNADDAKVTITFRER